MAGNGTWPEHPSEGKWALLRPVQGTLMYLSEDKSSPFPNIHRAACTKQEVLEAFLGRGRLASCQPHIAFTSVASLAAYSPVCVVSGPDASHIRQSHSCFCVMLQLLQFAGSILMLNLI